MRLTFIKLLFKKNQLLNKPKKQETNLKFLQQENKSNFKRKQHFDKIKKTTINTFRNKENKRK